MRIGELFLMLFYGLALFVVVYIVYGLFMKKPVNTSTTVIYETPTPVVSDVIYETPVVYPWYGGYNYWPYWWPTGYWGGGYGGGGWGYSTRPWRYGGGRGGR